MIRHIVVAAAVIVALGATEFALSGELMRQQQADRAMMDRLLHR